MALFLGVGGGGLRADDTTLAEGRPFPSVTGLDSAGDADVVARFLLGALADAKSTATVTVDYPPAGAVFPPEMVAPTLLWHDAAAGVSNWLIEVCFTSTPRRIYAFCDGQRAAPIIDPACVIPGHSEKKDVYADSARGWTPDAGAWEFLKQHSVDAPLSVRVYGMGPPAAGEASVRAADAPPPWGKRRLVSSGSVSFRTSTDPVGAPIFYRDVPLTPSQTRNGVVKPLAESAISQIKWRLRDVSKPVAPVVMSGLPTCANCHSFSRDGGTLAMDVDGPDGDKGAHTAQPVERDIVIESSEVFSWNDYQRDPAHMSFGLFPRVSPDGRHIAATVKETVYVKNYTDWRFLQTFYPTRGILAIRDGATGRIAALPGADDPRYVQTNPVWSPDGKELVFLRAKACDSYAPGVEAAFANDPRETQIQFDLYRIPFNDGKGGQPVPVKGASGNGKSNSFPAFSPDGKWIVYVQAGNGLLMRPDSRLFIIPAAGGEAREMTCNTRLMNSWHSWSPNSRWLVFASKSLRPFTQMFLAHVDGNGLDAPAVLVPGSTDDNRAVNLPEFAPIAGDGIAQITSPAADYRRHMNQGAKLSAGGDADGALAEMQRAVKLKPDYAGSLVSMGFLMNEMGRRDEAIDYCRRALALDAATYEAHFQWGNALYAQGKLDDAIREYLKALEIHPDYALARNNLGAALLAGGRREQAIEQYRAAAAADATYAAPHYNWGQALLQGGRMADAVARFEKAIELDPRYAEALQSLGLVLDQLGKPEAAVAYLRRAVESAPAREGGHAALADVLVRLGKLDEAVTQYEAATAANPQNHRYETRAGDVLLSADKPADAMRHYRKALAIEAGDDQARNNLAWILATHPKADVRNGKDAVANAELACRNTRSQNAVFMFTLATAYAEAGRFREAVKTGQRAIALTEASGDAQKAAAMRQVVALFERGKTFAQGQP